jgi:hypothetical protein
MNKNKINTFYIKSNNGLITLSEEYNKKFADKYISKLIIKVTYKTKIIEELYRITEIQSAITYFNILDIHSTHFKNKRLNRENIINYILPPIIELNDSKLTVYLENYWKLSKAKKIKEITTNTIIEDEYQDDTIIEKDKSFVFYISKLTPKFISLYNYPIDTSIIIMDNLDNKLILNNINRKTKNFHICRKYHNGKIIPYLDEDHLIGYTDFTESEIKDAYEYNIELNLNHPYNSELEKQFIKETNNFIEL